jgi:integrase
LLAQRAGLRGLHLHTLRHSATSFLLAAGTHTKVVQDHLGHSSYAITADVYSRGSAHVRLCPSVQVDRYTERRRTSTNATGPRSLVVKTRCHDRREPALTDRCVDGIGL